MCTYFTLARNASIITHCLTQLLTLTHSITLTHSFINSSIHSFTHTHKLTTQTLTLSLTYSISQTLIHSLTHLNTHSLTYLEIYLFWKKNAEDKYTRNSAFSEKDAIGFATYFFGYNGDCGRMLYLEDIYIKPAYRSKGYGTAVFKYMAKVGFNLIMLFYKILKYLHSIYSTLIQAIN